MDRREERGIPFVKIERVTKRFNRVVALKDVSISLRQGEIVTLVGDNGAGKSTLSKIVNGSIQPDTGSIEINGAQQTAYATAEAIRQGIYTVYQDLNLCDTLSVYENVFLGQEIVKNGLLHKEEMRRKTKEIFERLHITIEDINERVAYLSGGQRQAIAIARAILRASKMIIFDEPTAAMGVNESEKIRALMLQLRDAGVGLLLISHDMKLVESVSDRVYVLRHGEITAHLERETIDEKALIANMTGMR